MISCPKCEMSLHDGTVRCPLCGVPLELRWFRPDPDRPDPILDPLLDRFDRDEPVHYCPDCFNEFRPGLRQCRKCGVDLKRDLRSLYEQNLQVRPVWSLGTAVAAGPPVLPRDLVRIKIARGLLEVRTWLEELRFVGLEAYAGSDSLDPFDEPETVGLYVRAADREAAAYMVDGLLPTDPLTRPPPRREMSARQRVLETAQGFASLGKYRDALRWLGRLEGDPEGDLLASEVLLRAGRVRDAERYALRVGESARASHPKFCGCLLARAGLVAALAPDGTPFARGSDPDRAERLLSEAVVLSPRVMEVGKTRIDVLEALGRKDLLKTEFRRLDHLNPNLVGRDGPYRGLRDALG